MGPARLNLTKPGAPSEWLPPAAILIGLAALLAYTFRSVLTAGPNQLPGIDASVHYPWEVFTRLALSAGQLPYWNPYLFSGTPHLADVQTVVFYPPAVLLRWLRPEAFLSWQAVVHMWIGGAGTLFLARVAGVSWWGSAAAALVAAIGGTNAARLYNGHLLVINGVAWLPWALALSIRAVRRGTIAPSPALVLAMMLQFLSGYAQGSLYISAVVCLYFLYSVAWPDGERTTTSSRWRPFVQLIVLGLVSLGLAAFQLLPTLELAAEASRSRGLSYAEAAVGAWTFGSVATFFWPFGGIEGQPSIRFIADRIAYAGWLLTCVSPFAFLGTHRRRLAVFCFLLIALAVAFTMADLPFYRLHYAAFPGLREPPRLLFVATLGLAVLGGFGLEGLVRSAQTRQWRQLALPGAISIVAVCASALVALTHWKGADVAPIHGWPWIPIVATVGLFAVVLAARAGAVQTALAIGLLVCGIDLSVYAQGGAYRVSIESADLLAQWAGSSGSGRAASLCENRLDAQGLLLVRVPALTGPVGVALGDYIDWLSLLDTADRPADAIGDRLIRRDLLNSANVSTIVSCQPITAPSLTLASHVSPVFTYRNAAAWPRAIWMCEVEELDRSVIASRLARGRYDDARMLRPVINVRWVDGLPVGRRKELEEHYTLFDGVEQQGTTWQYLLHDASTGNVSALARDPATATSGVERPSGAIAIGDTATGGTEAREVLVGSRPCPDQGLVTVTAQDRPDGLVSAEVNASRPGFVFLSEPDYPERQAFVDGEPVRLRKANLAFVAIPVPAGRHRVELRYVPTRLRHGLAISGATVVSWAGVVMLGRMRRSSSRA